MGIRDGAGGRCAEEVLGAKCERVRGGVGDNWIRKMKRG